jgi:hypothetical protein
VTAEATTRPGEFAMGSIIDYLGNPLFAVFILLLLVVIVARSAILSLMTNVYGLARQAERTPIRVGLLFAFASVILAAAGLLYWASPSVRSDYAFLGSALPEDNAAIENRSALCFKRIGCYGAYAARLRCQDAGDFAQCLQERLGDDALSVGAGCGDLRVLYDEARASHAECLVRNTASVLMDAVSGFGVAGAR